MLTKLIAALGTLGLSFSSILVRFSNADSIVLAFYRMLFASLFLLPVLLLFHREEFRKLSIKDLVFCALSGVFFGMHLRFAFLSFASTSIASATVLVNTEVFFVAIGGILFAGEKITKGQWAGMLAAFAGSVLIAAGDAGASSMRLTGDFFALMGALSSAAYTLIGKRCRDHITTSLYTGGVYFFAMLTLGAGILFSGLSFIGFAPYNYLLALLLCLVCTFLGHSIFSWCLKYETASYVSLVKLLEPVFATIMGILFFREIPMPVTVIGGFIVIGGIVFYIRSDQSL